MNKLVKKISVILMMCMLISFSGIESMAAEISENDENKTIISEEENEISLEQEAEATNPDENTQEEEVENSQEIPENQEEIEYIYLDKKILADGEEQNIVVALEDEEKKLDSASLIYEFKETAERNEIEASNMVDNTVLFTLPYDILSQGSYRLIGVECAIGEEKMFLEFQEEEIAEFEVSAEDKGEDTEAMPEVTAYAMSDDGNVVEESGDNITEAVESAIRQMAAPTAISQFSTRARESRDSEFVIALDPGHDSHCGGAHANGLAEEVLTLKVANYCKEELEKYDGVKVIMTRTGAECPNPLPGSYSSAKDIRQRVQKAVQQGADVIVSFHFNSSGSGSANGAEVIYQNQSYDAAIGLESKALAEKIQKELVALGLKDRGIYSKDSTDGSHDPNGVKDDYWTLHNEAKALGKPAVLIEHAFVSGNVDSANLKKESYLKQLGIADAKGIINQYGLLNGTSQKEPGVGKIEFKATGEDTFDVVLSNVKNEEKIQTIYVPIWSANNNQDDIYWYVAQRQSDGTYKVSVDIKKHKGDRGNYIAHVYILDKQGKQSLAIDGQYKVIYHTASIETLKVNQDTSDKTKFDIVLSGVNAPNGVDRIQAAVWSENNGQDDIVWYTMSKQSNGDYKVQVNIANHKYDAGIYNIHIYLFDKEGLSFLPKATSISISVPNVSIAAKPLSDNSTQVQLSASNVGIYGNVQNVRFAVWSAENGQDDLKWYFGTRNNSGVWQVTIDASAHTGTGVFHVHSYSMLVDGTDKFLGNTQFTVKKQTTASIEKLEVNKTNENTFEVLLKGVTASNGVKNIQVPIWSEENGQDDLVWYDASKKADGTYYVNVDIKNHKYNTGIYNIHVYLFDNTGKAFLLKTTSTRVELAEVKITASDMDGSQKNFQLKAANVGKYGNVQNVRFAVWSAENGQDDLIWYTGKQNGSGTWTATAEIAKHKSSGTFLVHVYAMLADGTDKFLGHTSFEVKKQEMASIEKIDVTTDGKGGISINLAEVHTNTGVKKISVAVWSETNGQDDLVWYTAGKQNDGSYKVNVSAKNHKHDTGIYNIHIYLFEQSGAEYLIKTTTAKIEQPDYQLKAQVLTEEKDLYEISAANAGFLGNVKTVKFAVWSEPNGQNDIQWYNAERDATGVWKAKVDINKHDVSGKYNVHGYVQFDDGTEKFLGSQIFDGVRVYKIMGTAEATAEKMISYFKATKKEYPSEALGKGGASTIEEFCKIVESEAQAEGVKAEVVFAQAMVETGWLKFGGDVKIEQFNFCGLGATGNGAAGNSFPDVRTGIRAQVQHLKCYASDQPLNQECVDPRWGNWLRNKATSVQALSGKWAADKNYGNKLMAVIDAIK